MDQLTDEILVNYLQGKSSEAENKEILEWMKLSDENASKLFKLEELYHLGQFSKYESSERIKQAQKSFMQRINEEKGYRYKKSFFSRFYKYAAAIVIVLIVGGAAGLWIHQMYIEKNTIIATADGQNIKQIVLPDGTKVWLNKNTTLSYPKTFEDNKRNVELKGEAYFEVVKNPHKPFTVNSEAMDVRVLGTVFNFRTSGRNDLAEVSLLEGSVQVKGNNDEGVINIKPGQKVILDKINHCMIVQQTNTSLDAVWHNKMIPLENMNIHSIARILEHLYHVHITVASNVDAKMTYSGTIKYNETIDSVLTALRYSIPFEYRIDGNEVYIKK